MRTTIAGNWKMHKDQAEATALLAGLLAGPAGAAKVNVIVAPPFPVLAAAVQQLASSSIAVAAQNCHEAAQGAFTGEVSAGMLRSVGVTHCIIGHSERRQYFGETDAVIAKKVAAVLDQGMTPIFCCGERKEERESGLHFDVVTGQMKAALGALTLEKLEKMIIAYEPVWAIGTGLNATAQQAQDMHAHIRALLHTHSARAAEQVPVLYGGSCKPDNAAELFACPDVDGGLIGGASLVADQFNDLVRIAQRVKHNA